MRALQRRHPNIRRKSAAGGSKKCEPAPLAGLGGGAARIRAKILSKSCQNLPAKIEICLIKICLP